MSELSNGTKKHTLKSHETIPLSGWDWILRIFFTLKSVLPGHAEAFPPFEQKYTAI
jgi:hypothetical protein